MATRGHARTRAIARAEREALQRRPTSAMAAVLPGFAQLNEAYTQFIVLGAEEQRAHLQERKSYKPVLGVAPFSLGPGDITTFAAIYEVVRKLAYILLVGRFFGTQEDLGLSFILSAFIEDAVAMVRTAIDDTPASTQDMYRLQAVLRALLLAYLPPRAAADWRQLRASFLWPENFARGWTEAVRLHDLYGAIYVLTNDLPYHVRRVDEPSWRSFLHILEDAGPPWLVAVLHSAPAANITTRADMKALLNVNEPGEAMAAGGLNALRHSRDPACWQCGQMGHLARNCPLARPATAPTQQPTGSVLAQLQQDEAVLALLQRQERVQQKMIEVQARLAQADAQGIEIPPAPLVQMAAQDPVPGPAPFLVTNEGAQPAGYIYLGTNHGASIWGRADAVEASLREPETS